MENLHQSLKYAYDSARQHSSQVHRCTKNRYDKKARGAAFSVGERVWLYTPAVKSGRTKKFSLLWRGPYTVFDRTGDANYKIQLIGSSHSMIVHRNRLKPCYGDPTSRQHQSRTLTKRNPSTSVTEEQLSQEQVGEASCTQHTYADVTANRTISGIGGYTTAPNTRDISPPVVNRSLRPRHTIRPPDRYSASDYVGARMARNYC